MKAIFFSLLTGFAAVAQSIKGYVYDATTKLPVSSAIVQNIVGKNSTFTNAEGYFEINIQKIPTHLQVMLLGYETAMINIDQIPNRPLQISLKNPGYILPEVDYTYNYALSLLILAGERLSKFYKNYKYTKLLMRAMIYEKNDCMEINEFLYRVKINSSGILENQFESGRFAKIEDLAGKHLDFTVSLNSPIYSNEKNILFSDSVISYFNVSVVHHYMAHGHNVAMVVLANKYNNDSITVHIDTENHNIYYFSYSNLFKYRNFLGKVIQNVSRTMSFGLAHDSICIPIKVELLASFEYQGILFAKGLRKLKMTCFLYDFQNDENTFNKSNKMFVNKSFKNLQELIANKEVSPMQFTHNEAIVLAHDDTLIYQKFRENPHEGNFFLNK